MSYHFTAEEIRVLRERVASRQPAWIIANTLSQLPSNTTRGIVRNAAGVNQKLRLMNFNAEIGLVPELDLEAEVHGLDQHHDNLFQQRLSAAITRGSERAHVGVKKDLTPFVGRMMQPEPTFSGCGSSSATCVEANGLDGIGTGAR